VSHAVTLKLRGTYRLLAYYDVEGGPDDGRGIAIAYPLCFADDGDVEQAAAQASTDRERAYRATDPDALEAWDTEQDHKARPCIAYQRRTYAPETIVAAQAEVERLRAEWLEPPR
jgi:hypothetical protein